LNNTTERAQYSATHKASNALHDTMHDVAFDGIGLAVERLCVALSRTKQLIRVLFMQSLVYSRSCRISAASCQRLRCKLSWHRYIVSGGAAPACGSLVIGLGANF
jgi:hypothetical protein